MNETKYELHITGECKQNLKEGEMKEMFDYVVSNPPFNETDSTFASSACV